MIRAKDLMIGDWVFTPAAEPVTIKALPDGEAVYRDYAYIPITPEILEKNGFVEIKDYEPYVYYLLKAGSFSVSLEKSFDSFDNENYWSCSISNRKSDATLSIHTIHELQHALRLCEIEKEIVL